MSRCSGSASFACSAACIDRAAAALFAEALHRFGALTFRASGYSMLPSIGSGQLLKVTVASAEHIQVGDVILYRRDGRLVAHRLVRIARDAGDWLLVARGDAHWACDAPITAAQLLGRVAGIPGLRQPDAYVGSPSESRSPSRIGLNRVSAGSGRSLAANPGATR